MSYDNVLIIVILLAVLPILQQRIGTALHGAAALGPVLDNSGGYVTPLEEESALGDNFQESSSKKNCIKHNSSVKTPSQPKSGRTKTKLT